MSLLFFYFFATMLVLSGLVVILAQNPLYNVLSLVVATFCLSNLFLLLEAYFVGIILLLVYAGAVLIFFLFVVMCLNLNNPSAFQNQNRFKISGWLLGSCFLASFFLTTKSYLLTRSLEPSSIRGTIEAIGKILFTEYVLPFELTSFLLLVATFGIVSLAQGSLKSR
ncbi:MAG: NADH-quinone oxidoreductase subunit J [Candidatus Omnitrophica bacterium]|nr:NADH-quinone oxidoreductase subunit J [Candidatus Omnitrophota bacterium]